MPPSTAGVFGTAITSSKQLCGGGRKNASSPHGRLSTKTPTHGRPMGRPEIRIKARESNAWGYENRRRAQPPCPPPSRGPSERSKEVPNNWVFGTRVHHTAVSRQKHRPMGARRLDLKRGDKAPGVQKTGSALSGLGPLHRGGLWSGHKVPNNCGVVGRTRVHHTAVSRQKHRPTGTRRPEMKRGN